MALRTYLATEIALDHADGLLTRRDALHKLGLLGLTTAAASTLLASCSSAAPPAAAPSAAPAPPASSAAATPTDAPDYDVAAARARTQDVTFPGGTGTMSGAYAAADNPRGAVLVVHENRGLTDHIRAVAGRLAGDGYSALAPDLLSRAGGTAGVPDATAALGAISTADLVTDLRSGLTELGRRANGPALGVIGFCFGGGMVWQLLDSGPSELKAAVPFYGPAPDAPTVRGVAGRRPGRVRREGRPGQRGPGQAGGRAHRGRADPRDGDRPRGGPRVLQRHRSRATTRRRRRRSTGRCSTGSAPT